MPKLFNPPKSREIFCWEKCTGNNFPGILKLDQDHISAQFHSPSHEDLKLWDHRLLSLVTQRGHHVALYVSDVGQGTGEPDKNSSDLHGFKTESVVGPFAVVGRVPWTTSHATNATVARMWFSVPFVSKAFTDNELTRNWTSEIGTRYGMPSMLDPILETSHAQGAVRFFHQVVTQRGVLPQQTIRGLVCDISFSEGAVLQEAIGEFNSLLAFLELLWGEEVRATEVYFCPLKLRGKRGHCSEVRDRPYWRLMFDGESHELPTKEVKHDTLYRTDYDAELGRFREGLEAWMKGLVTSTEVNDLMMDYWRNRQRERSGFDLLLGHNWLAEIPGDGVEQISWRAEKKLLLEWFDGAFRDFPNDGLRIRAREVLASMHEEGTMSRLSRKVDTVRFQFPDELDGDLFLRDIKESWDLRNDFAHKLFRLTTKPEHEHYARAGSALEALCVLLSLSKLPLPDESKARIRAHPSISEYLEFQRVSRT